MNYSSEISPILELCDISRTFGNLTVFEKLSLEINEKDKLLISGKNGVGKSTLLNILAGQLSPSQGLVKENKKLKRGIFYDRDQGLFPHMTGKENIGFFSSSLGIKNIEHDEKFKYFLKSEAFKTALNQKFYKCSNGMKKLLLIFISQLHDPDLFLMDEPFTKLDDQNKKIILEFLEQFFIGKTIVCMSHEIPDSGMKSFKKMTLEDGKLC